MNRTIGRRALALGVVAALATGAAPVAARAPQQAPGADESRLPIVAPRDAAPADPELERQAARRIIVKYRKGLGMSAPPGLLAGQNLAPAGRLTEVGAQLVTVADPAQRAAAIAALERDPRVAYAEPDGLLYADGQVEALAPNDPAFRQRVLWGLHNSGRRILGRRGRRDVDIDALQAWKRGMGNDTIVAVIDSGVQLGHPDLKRNIWTNRDERPRNGRDDDRNGYVDDVHGWDFANRDNTVYDSVQSDFHGTHVAGTVGAVRDNRRGVLGVAPKVRIMPVKFLRGSTGTVSAAVKAIRYARRNGADVINASFGGPPRSTALRRAIQRFRRPFIASAGNAGRSLDGRYKIYPASFKLPNVVAVAAVNNAGRLYEHSNFGKRSVHVGAPGVDIVSTYPRNRYAYLSGTSMAAPHVAGVTALIQAQHPRWSNTRVIKTVKATGKRLRSLRATTVRGRMVNANRALRR